ncbi:valine dehydrogenase (NAD+) [Prauserella shujinwangii]|uniref:Valine dehydrogenase (NAD+) n=1 Tax=Prauserella shujinwangii TaxID=1453103 RepID=A0A2T0LT69_9PSEU|nr:Glu/Leu/Phe/Val dehydrogenase dimerization domain-containing protein [Prauserella shujinwangii]PRX46915.1 valine dehydrogenase (NAD+) [Prauserella shujinwangii]
MPALTESTDHEQVLFCQDRASGLRAIIAIHSTALGPALGGTRFHPYASEEEALTDVLRLSRAMAYKAACAGLDLGGGKAVIIGDPAELKSEALLRAYGRFVESLNGRYRTACDVGTYPEDMNVIARESRFVTGRTREHGGSGDSSVLTAFGVYQAMRAAARHTRGAASLRGLRVGVAGAGKVGSKLVKHLLSDGASVVVADVDAAAVDHLRDRHPELEREDPERLVSRELDIYAPCALAGALDEQTVPALRAPIVCGGANNQLAHDGIDLLLRDRGILYLPDYVVNAGGLIQVADEIEGFNHQRARARAEKIFTTCGEILASAADTHTTPARAADLLAERRMADVGRLRGLWLSEPVPNGHARARV